MKIRKTRNIKLHVRLQTILITTMVMVVSVTAFVMIFSWYRTYQAGLVDQLAASRKDVLMQISAKVELLQANMVSLSKLYSSLAGEFGEDHILEFYQGENSDQSVTLGELMEAYQDAADVEYSVMMLTDEEVLYVSPETEQPQDVQDLEKTLWYLNIPASMEDNEVYWTQSHEQPSLGNGFFFTAARKIYGLEDGFITVLLNISERMLYHTYENVSGSNCIYIVDEKGRVISSSRESLVSLNYFNMKRLNELVTSGSYTIVEKSGIEYLLSRYDNEKYNLVYLEEIPLETLMSPIRQMQTTSVLVSVTAIVLSCILIWWIVRKVTFPLLSLCRRLEMVSAGKLDTRFDVQSWAEVSLINDACQEMVDKISDLFENLKEEERQKRLAEIEFLQAQINPHFMYNTLFEIKCMVNLGENEDAEKMLTSFISMLRTLLSYKDEIISLQEELVILQHYFTVMQCKYGDEISLIYDIPEELLQRKILKFVLQPVVENSIFHGLEPKGNKGTIHVRVKEEKNRLFIWVEDDGIGMDEKELEIVRRKLKSGEGDSETVGISNVMKRIRLHFGIDYGVEIDSEKNKGTKVCLMVPGLLLEEVTEGGEND